ncbi:MAG: hypothetical protein A3F17_08700 [Gammaproteobacteria bacterium RIFCSPHIGHO2_12_FULL_41_15]|nr:MAG: hypothetical protein A3F17_08700 [Gammaproteobacteria bacterium RIFCSPHIGHO2_12_FULL_41_15]
MQSTARSYECSAQLVQTNQLDEKSIISLAKKEIIAIIVKNYYPKNICTDVANHIMTHKDYGYYANVGHEKDVSDVGRLGTSFFEVCKDPKMTEDYFNNASIQAKEIRDIFNPYYTPIDRLRLELEELWPNGAALETLHGKKMFVGLCRALEPGKTFLPHTDWFYQDANYSIEATSLRAQLAANIYLNVASKGGELLLWDIDINESDYQSLKLDKSYGLDIKKLPAPAIKINPAAGDLILFNAMRPHSVSTPDVYRLSQSCFIGYRGDHVPLRDRHEITSLLALRLAADLDD